MNREIERALAVLSVEYGLLDAGFALRMIRDARSGPRDLLSMIREEIPETQLLAAIAAEMAIRFVDMSDRTLELVVDEPAIAGCDMKMLTKLAALPMVDNARNKVAVVANPMDADTQTYLRANLEHGFKIAVATRQQILTKLMNVSSDFDFNAYQPGTNIIPEWVDYLFGRAVADGASDVHMRFLNNGLLLLRFRIDGVLRPIPYPAQLSGREGEVVASLLAKCQTIDPTNIREPQDGKFALTVADHPIDFRVGMLPQITGPNVTVRILDPTTLRKRPEEMGFGEHHLKLMRSAVEQSQGCIIVAGPTGSGKTTTLFSLLREVDALTKNVLTVEDPVEYRLQYIGQTQIREDLGDRSLTWARALRAIVRQDPDVILVGEIRDTAVAKTAMEASITGHLVLTTLHATNAPGVYLRMMEMGVEKFMVSEAISLIVSQRLVRKVHDCMVMGKPTAEEQEMLRRWGAASIKEVPHAVGCVQCAGTGYRGRLAASEILVPSTKMRAAIGTGQSKDVIMHEALACGWRPISADGLRLIQEGRTTVLELARVLGGDADSEDEDMVEVMR